MIFKTKILINQSKVNLDEKILFGDVNLHLDREKGKKTCKRFLWESKIPLSILVHDLCGIEVYIISFRTRILI